MLLEHFNENYINIAEMSSGKKRYFRNCEDSAQGDASVNEIIFMLVSKKLKGNCLQIKKQGYL